MIFSHHQELLDDLKATPDELSLIFDTQNKLQYKLNIESGFYFLIEFYVLGSVKLNPKAFTVKLLELINPQTRP